MFFSFLSTFLFPFFYHPNVVKMKTFVLMLVLALAPLAFAQSSACEENCCVSSGGSWDSDFESCDSAGNSYYSCINSCEGMAGANVSCCGSAAILLALLGGAMFVTKN